MNVRRARPATVEAADKTTDIQRDGSVDDHVDDHVAEEQLKTDNVPGEENTADDMGTEPAEAAGIEPAAPVPVPSKPPKHSPVWKDMLWVSIIFIGGYILMQFVVSAILEIVIFYLDPQIQDYFNQRAQAGESLTAVLNDPDASQFFLQRLESYDWLMTLVGDLSVVALFLIIRKKRLFTTDLTTTKPVNKRWFELGAALVFIFGIQLVLSAIDELISLSGYDPSSVQSNLLGSDTTTFTGFLFIVVIGPFLEEWIFRGAIMRQLTPYGTNFAIVTQAVFFAFWHSNLYQGIFAFFVGLILGYVASTFSLKWSYALHATSNGMSFLFGASWMPQWVPWVFFALAFVASAAIVVYFRQLAPLVVSEGAPQIEHPFQQGWKNPAFIVVAVIMVVISCAMMVLLGG